MQEDVKLIGNKNINRIEENANRQRDSNIELYRIFVMLLIVAHHYVVNSGLMDANGPIYSNPLTWRSLFLLIFGAWGKTGINCFVLITGYYMCVSKITLRKFLRLFLEIIFYRYVIQIVFWVTGYEAFSLKSAILTFIPINKIELNFTSCYMVFFLAIPFLNILVQHLTEKQHRNLLVLCSFTYILFGTIHRVTMNYASWFIVIYFIGSYIRLYPKDIYLRTKLWAWITVGIAIISILSVIACAWYGQKSEKTIAYYFMSDSNTVLAVLLGISSFIFFKNLKIKLSKVINTIASSAFGVLLIHASSDTMRQWLWKDILDNVGHYSSNMLVLHAVGSVLGIYIICTLIDQVRMRLIEKLFFIHYDKYENKEKIIKNR